MSGVKFPSQRCEVNDKKCSGKGALQGSAQPGENAAGKALPWFRLYTEIIDDDKLGLVAFEDRWHYVAILACKGRGLLDKGDRPELMLRRIGLKLGLAARELDEVVRRLAEVGLIDRETLQPLAWDSRQMRSDTDPTAADRKRRQRQKSKVTGMSRVTGTDVTRTDTDTDTEEEEEENNTGDAGGGAVVETADQLFERFWAAYPRKEAKDAARKAFDKRKPDAALVDAMVKAVAVQSKLLEWTKDRKQFIPHPATWINAGRWKDELDDCEVVGAKDSAGKSVPVTSQQRDFTGTDYGDNRVPDWMEQIIADNESGQGAGAPA